MAAHNLRPGQVIQLVGSQRLWDVQATPWTELGAGDRLTVTEVQPLSTGRTGRQPYEVTLASSTGHPIGLELESGNTIFYVVPGPGET